MTNAERDRSLAEAIRKELDAAVAGLDSGTLERLRQARQRALAGAGQERRRFFLPLISRRVTAGGLAAAAVVVIAVSFWVAMTRTPQPARQPEDLEILTSQEHLDLYADLEFYRWLAPDDDAH